MSSTTIEYTLESNEHVQMELLSADGRDRSLLLNDYKVAGAHSLELNVTMLQSGMYLLLLKSANRQRVHRLIIR